MLPLILRVQQYIKLMALLCESPVTLPLLYFVGVQPFVVH